MFSKSKNTEASRSPQPGGLLTREDSPDVFNALLVEEQGTVLYANTQAAVQLGYEDPSELIGRPLSQFRTSHEMSNFYNPGGSNHWARGIRKNGSLTDLRESISTLRLPGHLLTIRASSSASGRYSNVHSTTIPGGHDNPPCSRDLALFVDAECNVCIDEQWLEFTGQSMEQALQNGYRENVHQVDAHACHQSLEFAFRNRKPFRLQYRMRRGDGHYRWFLCTAAPHYLEDGTFDGFRGVCSDISDLKNAREELRKTETQMAAILDNSPNVIFLQDVQGRYLRINRKFEEVFQATRHQVIGKTDYEIFPGDSLCLAPSGEHPNSRTSSPRQWKKVTELAGERRTFKTETFALIDSQGLTYGEGSILTDITELQSLEQQLNISHKLENIGRLTSGLAHDFNNLLTGIMIYCGLLLTGLPKDSRLRRHVQEIFLASERGAALISQLLIVSRDQQVAPAIINLNEVVLEMQDLLVRVSGENIQLHTNCAADLKTARLDRTQIHQVILNLVLNARDAMPGGGTISLSTTNKAIAAGREPGCAPLPAGSYVALSVSDSGAGMDQASQSQIFDPFYSTKAPGKGTGLGLTTVARIVRQSSGFIVVNSRVGEGTEFILYFPVAEGIAEVTRSQITPPQPVPPGDSHTVLLVEDDDLVRRSVSETLSITGYNVLSARNGPEALDIIGNYSAPISLMITDLEMPGMSGRVLAQRLSVWRPEIQILMVSGHAGDPSIAQLPEREISFFGKPFSPNSLMKKVGELLRGANAGKLTDSGK